MKSSGFILKLGKITSGCAKKPAELMQQTTVIVCISQILQGNENKGSLRIHISQSKSIQFQRVRAHYYGLWICVLFGASNVILKINAR